jgi:putative oxidoreductase
MCFKKIAECLAPLKNFAEAKLTPVVLLAMRLYVAWQFFKSGRLKLGYVLNDQLDTLYSLFETTYKVPFLPTKIAAWMGMCGELGLSTLLALGLFARFGALGLIFMSGLVYYVEAYNLDAAGSTRADYWALICALIAVHGPGKLSLDALLFRNKTKEPPP